MKALKSKKFRYVVQNFIIYIYSDNDKNPAWVNQLQECPDFKCQRLEGNE